MPRQVAVAVKRAPLLAPTAVLMNEHRNIEKALAALERMAESFAGKGRIDPEPAGQAVEFLRLYADRLHHGKEEANLFPAMEARGLPSDVGPTAVMREEHTMGRAFIKDMGDALGEGDTGAFVDAARGYVALLREHIMKEDQVLFPMADRLLPPEDQDVLRGIFEKVERVDIGTERVASLLATVEGLCARYGVTEIPRTTGGPCGHCCGH
jgi:hemerythrin-like domain-containing protein